MKRYFALAICILVLFVFFQHWMNKQAQANMLIALTVYGQVPTHPGHPLRPSPGEPLLIEIQLRSLIYEVAALNADIVWVQSLPAGRIIHTDIGTSEDRDIWIGKAQAEVLVQEAFIAELQTYQ